MHDKNNNALMNYRDISYFIIENENILNTIDLKQFDCVYSPSFPINVSRYPNTKFLFGPHFSVFPESQHMEIIKGKNSIYIQPSEWAKNLWLFHPFCRNIRLETLPFGVDTIKFSPCKPISERINVFIYYKSRNPDELNKLCLFLKNIGINPKIFNYLTKYNEKDYLNCLHNAKFGVWVGRHESQGFALQEALSCNVPLLVWDVKSMNQEYGYNYEDIPATTIPYWDNRCGEYFTDINNLHDTFNKFIDNLQNYKPREYILENLSIEKCSEKFINIVNNI